MSSYVYEYIVTNHYPKFQSDLCIYYGNEIKRNKFVLELTSDQI